MFKIFKKNPSIPPEKVDEKEPQTFEGLIPTINDLPKDEIGEMKELKSNTRFLSEEEEKELREKIKEEIREENKRRIPEDSCEPSGYEDDDIWERYWGQDYAFGRPYDPLNFYSNDYYGDKR